jgi:hypothetical protein
VHVIGFENVGQLSFAAANRNASAESMDSAAEAIRHELRAMGRSEVTSA